MRHAPGKAINWGRVRVPLALLAFVFLATNLVFQYCPAWFATLTFVAALALYLRLGGPTATGARRVEPPVSGRWLALNTPADHVPSHGLHAYGQTYAIDLVAVPSGEARPVTGWWPITRPPEDFPGFGEEVLSPAAGAVVRVRDGARDHRSRNSWPAFAFLFIEGGLRELTGPGRILGNHVILDLGEGIYAALAHLQRDSVVVREGERVRAGDPIGRCGNSGNSSEPHLHFQLMDHPAVALADGVPFAFPHFDETGTRPRTGVPDSSAPFLA